MNPRTPGQRAALALPSAREIHAVRITGTEERKDRHGRTRTVAVTKPWPPGFTVKDVLTRVLRAGLR